MDKDELIPEENAIRGLSSKILRRQNTNVTVLFCIPGKFHFYRTYALRKPYSHDNECGYWRTAFGHSLSDLQQPC